MWSDKVIFCKVQANLLGHLGADAEFKETSGGYQITNFSVAASTREGKEDKTFWFRCTIWGKRGEKLAPFLKKGKLVYVSGSISNIKDLELNVDDIKILTPKDPTAQSSPTAPAPSREPLNPENMDDLFWPLKFL